MGIFDKKNVEKATEEAAKKRGNKITDPDVYIMNLEKGHVATSKTSNDPMIVLTFSHEEYDPIDAYYVFNKKKPEQALKLVGIMKNGFDYTFEPVDAMTSMEEAEEVLKQIESFYGKQLKVAVSIEQDLYEKMDNGVKKIFLTQKPKIWYVGLVTQKLTLNKSKAISPLSPEKAEIWNKYQLANPYTKRKKKDEDDQYAENNEQTRAAAVNESFKTETPPVAEEDDDLPF